MDGELQGKETIREFILGGMATFTIRSKGTHERYTYRVKRARRFGDRERPYFVSVLRSEHNDNTYDYLGCIWTSSGRYVHGKRSYVKSTALSTRAFYWFWQQLQKRTGVLDQVEFFHAGTCARCGRLLTVPESIESGWGPVCAMLRDSAAETAPRKANKYH